MWLIVEKLSGSDRWFSPRRPPGQKIRSLPQNFLCCNTSPDLPLLCQKSVFRSILLFTFANGSQQSFIAFLSEIFPILKSNVIYSLAFSFLG